MNHEWAGVIDVIHEHEISAICRLKTKPLVGVTLRVICH
jgi:hypothetical protein